MSVISYSKSIFLFAVYLFIVLTAFSYLLDNKQQIVYFEWGKGRMEDMGDFTETELKLNFNLVEKMDLPFEHISVALGPLYFLRVLLKENKEEEAYKIVRLIAQYVNAETGTGKYYSEEYGINLEEVLIPSDMAEVFKIKKKELILGVPPIRNIGKDKCLGLNMQTAYLGVLIGKNRIFVDKNGDKVVICVDK